MRRILAIMADQHAGSSLALMSPSVRLMDDDGAEYTPSLHAVRRRLDSLVRDGRATTRMVQGDYYGRAQRAWRIIT